MDSSGVRRQCTGNRYCNFSGPVRLERILLLGDEVPRFVGACWFESFVHPDEPARFVCNRCAHRTPHANVGGRSGIVWSLRCPFDGEPLGHGKATSLVGNRGKTLARFDGTPTPEQLGPHVKTPERDESDASSLLATSIEAYKRADYLLALRKADAAAEQDEGVKRLSLLIRARTLDHLGRDAEASAVRAALQSMFMGRTGPSA